MAQTIIFAIFRTFFAFLLLLLMARLLGRKGISQMTYFDFAVIISLGSVSANLALGQRPSFWSSSAVLVTFGLLAIVTGYLHIKSMWVRKLTNSVPVVAIENGKILDKNMAKIRFTIDELTSLLRKKNIFSYGDVEFAVIESNGELSLLPKSQKKPLTPADLNLPTSYVGLTQDLIIDGKILDENLHSIDLDEKWLIEQLSEQGVLKVSDVFYAGLDSAGNLYVSVRQAKPEEKHGEHGIE